MVKKRPLVDPSPSYSYHAAREDARARMRHQALLQDYQDLIKETVAKKKQILKAKQKKRELFAEVKFLRRKLKSFLGDHSFKIPLKLRKESYRVASPSPEYDQIHNSGLLREARLEDRSHEITEAATRGTSALSDLNQISNRYASSLGRYAQLQNSSLQSSTFSVDRKVTEAADRRTTALLDLNQASKRQGPSSISYAHMHNSDLPPKAPQVDRNHKVTQAATLKITALSDSNPVSYRQATPSSRYSHMHYWGLPPKSPQNYEGREAATQGNTVLFDLNQVSYRPSPPSARCAHMNNSNLPNKGYTVGGKYKVTEATTRVTSTLLDLNQDVEEFEEQKTPRIDSSKRFSVGGSAMINDHKLLLRRGGRNDGSQLPLRVYKQRVQSFYPFHSKHLPYNYLLLIFSM